MCWIWRVVIDSIRWFFDDLWPNIHQRLLLLDAFCGEKSGSCQMYIHQNTDLVQAEEKFKELAEAYSILSNADKRKHYDLDAWIWMRHIVYVVDRGISFLIH